MGQRDVIDLLRANKNVTFTTRQIASALNVSLGSVTNNVTRLKKVSIKEIKVGKNLRTDCLGGRASEVTLTYIGKDGL